MADRLTNYPFDLRLAKARDEINEALGQRMPNLGPAPNQQQMQIPGNPQLTDQGLALSGYQQLGPGALSGGAMVGPQGFGGASANYGMPVAGGQLNLGASVDPRMQMSNLQAQYQRGPFSAGVQYQPGGGVSGGVQYRQAFQEGGLATSLRTDPVHHERDVDFINTRNQHMRELAGMNAYAKGGLAMAEGGDVGDEIVVQARRDMSMPMFYGNVASLVGGGNYSGGGGEFFGAPGAGGPAISSYDIGALQNAINQAPKKPTPAPVEVPKPVSGPSAPVVLDVGRVGGNMRPSYGGGQADVMRIMDIGRNVGSAPKGVGARLGIGFAKGGGAWTRKEGKNPEGGLNAVGRASLKAQGQDIKPPVSAKQAKKSPKAAARRRSFCARMSGMPGPMKDDGGKPTRKALALRKWDC